MYRGDVKKVAAAKVEGYYQLFEGQASVRNKVKELLTKNAYIYLSKQVSVMLYSITSGSFTWLLL